MSRSQRSFAAAGRKAKNRAKGEKRQSRGKRSRESHQGKHAIPAKDSSPPRHPPDIDNNDRDLAEAVKPSQSLSIEASTLRNKITEIRELHKQWRFEDRQMDLQGKELVARQRQRCKDARLVIFGFTLQEAQVDAMCTIFYEQKSSTSTSCNYHI
ncbi:hypothetical protein MMC31_008125, partial [Peltigera leucophlebia]|nr:hypothetical protein [Peltigera leucophlebia]